MTCPEMKALWEKYINGNATEEEQNHLEMHLQECEKCSEFFNQQLDEVEPKAIDKKKNQLQYIDFSDSLRKAKWKQRFSLTLFIIAVIIFVLIIGTLSSQFYYSGKKLEQISTIETAAVESLLPNVHSQGGSMNRKSFFRMENQMDLAKSIGNEGKFVGQIKLSHSFSKVSNVEKRWNGGRYDLKLYFVHPSLKANDDLNHWNEEFWKAIEKLPEGTVSEVALSFDKPYTIEEMDGMLSKVFLDERKMPIWYALDTGESDQEDPYLGPGQVLGFYRYFNLDKESESKNYTKEQRVKKLIQLLAENEDTVQNMQITFGKLSLNNSYQYIKKNGVKIYGVVLTGPTKEFLQLKDMEQIKFASLGDVELWNWYDRPVSGEMR
ncbi:anti sigma factor C-terminal domain-containing protein [Neobacillus sp.]|uniref:anti-sigma factor n=1 Tax=Neobacillus sp. TaxID=2675273 RepID=UPI0028979816|nr:anti sigma factor C-terminal domain-containing protein [Neobacillus sp.]